MYNRVRDLTEAKRWQNIENQITKREFILFGKLQKTGAEHRGDVL